MKEKDLEEMGLVAKGDRAKLVAFCSREVRKKQLKEIIEKGKSTRVQTKVQHKSLSSTSTAPKSPRPTLKVELRWKHYVDGIGYKVKKAAEGGGVRVQTLSRLASLEECHQTAENLFFPNGENPEGSLEDLITNLADFKGDLLDSLEPFTLEGYKSKYALHTVRLVLLTRAKKEVCTIESSDESSDEGISAQALHMKSSIFDVLPRPISLTSPGCNKGPDSVSSLIGTTSERATLRKEINEEYEKSLSADRAKQNEDRKEEEDIARRERLRATRKRSAPPEPASSEPHISISVRHPDLGVVSRSFALNSKASGVYSWVGSLASSPEHFALIQPSPRRILYPDANTACVASSMLYMEELDNSLPCLTGGDTTETSDKDVQGNSEPQQVEANPPNLLMEGDDLLSTEEERARELVEGLNSKRCETDNRLDKDVVESVNVSRHNCFKELLELYQDNRICQSKLYLHFKGEEAVGHGVSRDVFALFWEEFVTNYCEGVSQFTFTISPNISPHDYVTLGCILTHQFILTGTLPLQLSEALIQQAVVGKVSDDCLLESFMMLMHEKEREIVREALLGESETFPKKDIIDILSDYNTGTVPKPENIRQILLQVSTTELVAKPFMCILKLREGMGSFWDGVSAEEIHALYMCCTPTPNNVIRSLFFKTSNQQEEKIARWLVRYVKSQDHKSLGRFIRFCTGSDLVYPGKFVKVQIATEPMSDLAIRPQAQACFNIITLSKNYRSYAHFLSNIDFYMHNPQMWEFHDQQNCLS